VRDEDLDVREAAGLGFVERRQSKKSLREKAGLSRMLLH
jgi:hypothetical protein